MDNSSNAHIFSEEDILTDNIYPIIYNGVATIGGKDIIQKGVGIFSWSYTGDDGQMHTNKFNNIP